MRKLEDYPDERAFDEFWNHAHWICPEAYDIEDKILDEQKGGVDEKTKRT